MSKPEQGMIRDAEQAAIDTLASIASAADKIGDAADAAARTFDAATAILTALKAMFLSRMPPPAQRLLATLEGHPADPSA